MESYIMSSVELDQQFIDNASDDYMSDEEREYQIDLEEGVTEEEEVVLYEVTEDTAINFAFDTLVGMFGIFLTRAFFLAFLIFLDSSIEIPKTLLKALSKAISSQG